MIPTKHLASVLITLVACFGVAYASDHLTGVPVYPESRTVAEGSTSFDDDEAVHEELRRAVQHLEPKYQAVISLYYWQGLSYHDIADVLGAPLGSVKVWMSRAKSQLRKELA
jgi:RNA polymerase sigma factor (sigma-70 family)